MFSQAADGPLTPTLSPEYGGEGAGMPPLPLAGEGWGEGASRSRERRLKFIASQECSCARSVGLGVARWVPQ